MLTVCCVLRSGGDFQQKHVQALWDGVERHLTLPHRFICLSDVDVPCERVPLRNDWPGWFSKIELFRPALFWTQTVYFDLDTVIVGRLDDMMTGHRFTVLDDWLWPGQVNSSVMAWDYDLSEIYLAFGADPARFMREYQVRGRWGDQDFIRDHMPVKPERWQDKHPGKIVSFKKHVLPRGRIPEGAAVVAFHGRPRPWRLSPMQAEWFEQVRA